MKPDITFIAGDGEREASALCAMSPFKNPPGPQAQYGLPKDQYPLKLQGECNDVVRDKT